MYVSKEENNRFQITLFYNIYVDVIRENTLNEQKKQLKCLQLSAASSGHVIYYD